MRYFLNEGKANSKTIKTIAMTIIPMKYGVDKDEGAANASGMGNVPNVICQSPLTIILTVFRCLLTSNRETAKTAIATAEAMTTSIVGKGGTP